MPSLQKRNKKELFLFFAVKKCIDGFEQPFHVGGCRGIVTPTELIPHPVSFEYRIHFLKREQQCPPAQSNAKVRNTLRPGWMRIVPAVGKRNRRVIPSPGRSGIIEPAASFHSPGM